jgi:hypothetical protein
MSETAGCGMGPKSGTVSLTSVCSKVLEHIFHSHIIKHMDKLGLLADSQHGLRKRRSTETQLIPFIDDLAKSLDVGEQIDCILLDFSFAFLVILSMWLSQLKLL